MQKTLDENENIWIDISRFVLRYITPYCRRSFITQQKNQEKNISKLAYSASSNSDDCGCGETANFRGGVLTFYYG